MEATTEKIVICVRKDLNMRKGKIAVQAVHACFGLVNELKDKRPELLEQMHYMRKICVQLPALSDVGHVTLMAEALDVPCYTVTDLGLTEFNGNPTVTVCAVGPATDDVLESITGGYQLL